MRVNQPVGVVQMTNIAIIKYKTNNKKFEIACYKNKAINWRNGVEKDLSEVLQVDEIFTNATRGDVASKRELEQCFGQIDRNSMIKLILEKGDLQVGDKERGTQIDQIYKDIVKFIQEKCVHSTSGRQLTQQSIEFAISKVAFIVRTDQPLKRQALSCVKKLKEQFFIKRAPMKIQLTYNDEQMQQLIQILTEMKIEEMIQEDSKLILTIDPSLYRPISKVANEIKCKIEVVEAIVKKNFQTLEEIGAVDLEQRVEKIQVSDDESSDEEKDKKEKKSKQKQQQPQQQKQKQQQQQQQQQQKQADQLEKQGRDLANAVQKIDLMDKQFKCTTCQISYSTNPEFRQHYKTEWHNFNMKQKSKGIPYVTYEEYLEMQITI